MEGCRQEKRIERDVSMHGRSEQKKLKIHMEWTSTLTVVWFMILSNIVTMYAFTLPTSGSNIHAQACDLKWFCFKMHDARMNSNKN